ncbi:DNA-3-methyladenine glycosylase [Patescibacteria group bacterium AH-259-L07]|nr:DNA-3-methyladenine glycosylase [Patescibacteria group bacterium AH-259-L07]
MKVAKALLGKFLVRRYYGKEISLMITEVEAYDGFKDKASHASYGRTERNKIMFEGPGIWYVYFIYGTHWMLNIVTGKKNYPAAVLIRGSKQMHGPGRITKYLHIDKRFNGLPTNKDAGLWIEDRGIKIKRTQIQARPRIGVDYAGMWAYKPYRFRIKDFYPQQAD